MSVKAEVFSDRKTQLVPTPCLFTAHAAFQIESSLLQTLNTMATAIRNSIGRSTNLTSILEEELDVLQRRIEEIPVLVSQSDQSLLNASSQCKTDVQILVILVTHMYQVHY